WGNSVSCKDIADLWLHEGFCTYSEALYVECKHGYDIAMDYVNAKKPGVGNEAPLIGDYLVNSEGSSDMYSKGMLILNTLRHTMDDDEKWFSIVRGLTVDFKNTTVSSAEVEDYIATKSGLNLDKFWDQYLRQASPPVLETRKYKKGKKLIVEYRWKAIDGFDMPLKASYERDGEEFTMWIKPTTEWRSKVLKKVESDSFKWDEAHFYYLIDKGMEKEDVTSEKED
ncbi:MAG: aminopeptidase N, partial [Limisphaerales bacterium]